MPAASPPFVLGIDGGATHTSVVLSDALDLPLAEFRKGPANLRLLSDLELGRLFVDIQRSLPSGTPLSAVGIGLAGARTAEDHARVRRVAARIWKGVPCHATDDLETVLAAAPAPIHPDWSARIVVLSGTGSCCYGRDRKDRTWRTGGRGHIIGDRGSACDIGLRAVRTVMAAYDRSEAWPELGAGLLAELLLNDPEDLVPWSMRAEKRDLAGLAIPVFAAAQAGDPMARTIIGEAAETLAEDALACARHLAMPDPRHPVQFLFSGGVLIQQQAFAEQLKALLTERWSGVEILSVERAGAWGAVVLARALLDSVTTGIAPAFPVESKGESDTPVRLEDLVFSPTEQRNPASLHLDRMPLEEAVAMMLEQDAALPSAILKEREAIVRVIRRVTRAFSEGGRLFYVGAGTSGRLGVLDASECPPTFRTPRSLVQGIIAGGDRALRIAVEGAEDDSAAGAEAIRARRTGSRDVVVGIAASGRTPFVWGALRQARKQGAFTVILAFNPRLHEILTAEWRPDEIIAPDLGPEVLTGSTRLKSGTATKLILNLFTTLALAQGGKVIENLMVDVDPSNTKLRARAVRILRELTGCPEELAKGTLESCGWVVRDAYEEVTKAVAPPPPGSSREAPDPGFPGAPSA